MKKLFLTLFIVFVSIFGIKAQDKCTYCDQDPFGLTSSNIGVKNNNYGIASLTVGEKNVIGTKFNEIQTAISIGSLNSIGTNVNLGGSYAIAIGSENQLFSDFCYAIGNGNNVSSKYGFAFGSTNTVSGENAIAIGINANASGEKAISIGELSKSTSQYSLAVGRSCESTDMLAISYGFNSKANNIRAVAIGTSCIADKMNSIAFGRYAKASAKDAMTIGIGLSLDNPILNTEENSLVIGFNSTLPTFFVGKSFATDKTGRIGIGNITVPEAKLHIKADNDEDASLYLQPTGAGYFAQLFLGDMQNSIISRTGANMDFNIDSLNNFVFNSGNVGIGTSGPTHKLEVNGNFSVNMQAWFQNNIIQTTGFYIQSSQIKAPDASGLNLTNQNGNGIFVDNAGNVGVGTTTPTSTLDVAGTIKSISFIGDGAGLTNITGDNLGNHLLSQNLVTDGHWINGDCDDNEGVFIDMDGKVGIGTSIPDSKVKIISDDVTGLIVETNHDFSYGYGIKSKVLNSMTKALTIEDSNGENIVIYGSGKTYIDNTLYAKEIEVRTPVWGDHVLKESYKLMDLINVEDYIKKYGHLPEVPSETEVLQNGINLGDMDRILLQKIEELTLYILELNESVDNLKLQNLELTKQLINK